MMNLLKYSAAVLLFLTATHSLEAAVARDFERTIARQFEIAADGEVELTNKYGMVNVETWDRLEVKIEVTIVVEAKNEDRANSTFDRIDIQFSNSTAQVSASTEISSTKGWSSWFGSSGDEFEVNYKVWLPASVKVSIDNKYGDIFLASIEGDADIVLKYGNMRVDAIGGDVTLDMGYSKGSISSSKSLDMDVKYSSLRAGNMGDVSAITKYSTFEADEVGLMQSTSSYDAYSIKRAGSLTNIGKYDDIVLESVGTVIADTKYSSIEIGKLTDEADLQMRHGALKIQTLEKGFSKVDVEGEYTGISIATASDVAFDFEVYGKYCSVKVPNADITYEVRKNTEDELKGHRGVAGAGGSIKITSTHGAVKID